MTAQREEIGTIRYGGNDYTVTAIIDDERFHKLLNQLAKRAIKTKEMTAAMGNGAIRVKIQNREQA